jgi:N-acetylmuramoyl-L-alanine amidase
MEKYIVGAGESIPSIAKDNGFFWQMLWNHPDNADLKAKRKDPNVLMEGDEVTIPDPQLRQESGATEARHKFVRKGEPHMFKLRLMRMNKPRANEAYVLKLDGKLIRGQTDATGLLQQSIPGNAKGGRLLLKNGKEQYPICIGGMDPVDEISGLQHRLNNLGFPCEMDGNLGPRTKRALLQFQAQNNLPATGKPDDATKGKLSSMHP